MCIKIKRILRNQLRRIREGGVGFGNSDITSPNTFRGDFYNLKEDTLTEALLSCY